jgi:putative hydrolase of the HAD superfamily
MSTDAILLDAGGVFLLPDEDAVARELGALGVSFDRSRCPRAHYAGMHAIDITDAPDWREYNRAYVRELGVEVTKEHRKALNSAFVAMEWNVLIEGSLSALPALAECAQLAIVSNSDGTVERLLRGHGIGDDMVAILDSHVVGIEKPDPRIFEMVLVEIGVSPDNAVHVGDSVRFDVVGARNAGVRPVHMDPFGFCDETDHDHITALADVLKLLD